VVAKMPPDAAAGSERAGNGMSDDPPT